MKGKYKILLSIIFILIIVVVIVLGIKGFSKKKNNNNNPDEINIPVLESIEKYGYSLHERDSLVMKETYEELKTILNNETIEYEEYAKSLAKLFVIDLWTMNNKTNRYDVGGIEYIYPDNVANYKLNVENTIYKNIENNVDGKRKQELPAVKSITDIEVHSDKFKIGDNEEDSYVVSLMWDYDKDLGYENKAKITMIKKDNKLYIVEYTSGE